jgi:serine/threonine protein kinase
LAQALDSIHQDSILHRNINPSNIYFKEINKKYIKMGGFSFAKRLEAEEFFSSTCLPNTCYLSPEQIQSGIFTKQTDVWALGSLMY